ncbi:hypothetical protein BDB01DRAFT_851999 [Pilobolus umbonatus]|nr:hypothetical protein BDB01DRAFT_851999 [Pilobolus umbonatus]
MLNITREQAICMLYCEPYCDETAAKLLKGIVEINLDICYQDDPTSPIILSARSIDQNPFKNKRYQGKNTVANIKTIEDKEYPRLKQVVHLIEFLNEVYLPSNTGNNEMYESKNVSMREIFCQLGQKERWMKMDEDGNKTATRGLYVLKEEFIDKTVESIISSIEKYQLLLKELKDENHRIIGYARKSKNKKDDDSRIRLLNQMAQKLEERSLVDMVFMSPTTNSNEPISSRDISKDNEMMSQLKAHGDTQGKLLLKYISNEEKIVIVTIDYAGLAINCEDLQVFLEDHKNNKRIFVDLIPYTNTVKMYTSEELLNNPEKLKAFDSRKHCLQRSK